MQRLYQMMCPNRFSIRAHVGAPLRESGLNIDKIVQYIIIYLLNLLTIYGFFN
ncbi:hypothetical protein [Coleofasciculus sp.]|uniref:hypothetical protein n=1 Tax=Coleofasciculus sp. TaxID=3100458 RepID=UPI003A4402C2